MVLDGPINSLWTAIGATVGLLFPQECVNYFAAAAYDTDVA